jgi:hypothetical protein
MRRRRCGTSRWARACFVVVFASLAARSAFGVVFVPVSDAALRQRADVEAIILARRHGTTLAPTLGLNAADAAVAVAPSAR